MTDYSKENIGRCRRHGCAVLLDEGCELCAREEELFDPKEEECQDITTTSCQSNEHPMDRLVPKTHIFNGLTRETTYTTGETDYGIHVTGPGDKSLVHLTYPQGYDSRCGWCWLGASHSEAAHLREIMTPGGKQS